MMNKLKNIIRRGLVSLLTDDTEKYPRIQITSLGVAKNVERFSPYGLYYNPPLGATSILFNIQGQADNVVSMSQDYINRPKGLSEGDVAVGNTITQRFIFFNNDGKINLGLGGNGIARLNDSTIADAATDPSFEAFRLAFNIWAGGLGLGTPMPASRTGKISTASTNNTSI